MVVIKGNMTWIIPLLIIIATASITLYTICPMTEYFTQDKQQESENDINIDSMNEKELDNKIRETKKILNKLLLSQKEKQKQKKQQDLIQLEKDENKINDENENLLPLEEKKDEGKIKKNEKTLKITKEKFTSFDNSGEILRPNWRETNMPSTLEKYKGPIQGYNCGNYSEFTYNKPKWCPQFGECNPDNYKTPPGSPSSNDYIFPGRKRNCSGVIKYANKPHLLEHENDVNQKILEYESAPVFRKQKVENIQYLHNPQYMYHRRSGKLDSVITDANRFEVGAMNAFGRSTNEYSTM